MENYADLTAQDKELVDALVEWIGMTQDEAIEKRDDYYIYQGTAHEYACEMAQGYIFEVESSNLPEAVKTFFATHIDYDRYARELLIDSNVIELSYNKLLIG